MTCYHPISAFQTACGSVVFSENKKFGDITRNLSLPCGRCVGCRLERSRQWAIRCMHESKMHEKNCFITLTFNDDNLPKDLSLDHRVYQLFMKRLRKKYGNAIRFYMAGEYGETFGRPHYHACIFGMDFADKVYHGKSPSGSLLYTSKTLEQLWPYGYSTIGDVNFESAAYVARYIMKKITGDDAKWHLSWTDLTTGEIIKRKPEYNAMSRRKGIGHEFFEKYHTDIYARDSVIVRDKQCKPPRYYDKEFAKLYPDEFESIQYSRILKSREINPHERSDERLAVKKQVTEAKLKLLKRTLV